MKLNLKTGAWYGDNNLSFMVPENSDIKYFWPNDASAISTKILRNKIEHYIETLNFEKVLTEQKRICLIVDDITRPTPIKETLELLLNNIFKVNPRSEVCILIANGAHKPMTIEEIEKKIGKYVIGKIKIINHNFMGKDLVFYGEVLNGPVFLNKHFVDADIRITIGGVLPHNETGFGGGAKLIVPGIAGADTIAFFHGALIPRKVGQIDGKSKIDRRDWAEKVASKFNVISFFLLINSNREIVDVYCGDIIKTHRIAAKKSAEIGRTAISKKDFSEADFCIINCYPLDTDPIQMGKAIFSIKKHFSKNILVINAASDGIFYHGMGMGSGIDGYRLINNLIKKLNTSYLKGYLKIILKLVLKPYLFLRYTYYFINALPFNQFHKKHENLNINLKPDENTKLIIFSKNFPPSGLIKKYPKARLICDLNELEQFSIKYIQKKRIIIFPCAPIQLIELSD
jgi:nickel-dependent lactate racemase